MGVWREIDFSKMLIYGRFLSCGCLNFSSIYWVVGRSQCQILVGIKRMASNRQNAISKPHQPMCIKSCLNVHQKVYSSDSKDAQKVFKS